MEQDQSLLIQQLSQYQQQLESDDLTSDEFDDISRKISRIKVKIFLNGVRDGNDDS